MCIRGSFLRSTKTKSYTAYRALVVVFKAGQVFLGSLYYGGIWRTNTRNVRRVSLQTGGHFGLHSLSTLSAIRRNFPRRVHARIEISGTVGIFGHPASGRRGYSITGYLSARQRIRCIYLPYEFRQLATKLRVHYEVPVVICRKPRLFRD